MECRRKTTPILAVYKQNETLQIARAILSVLTGPVAREVEGLLTKQDYASIANLAYNPLVHSHDDFLAINLLKKCPIPCKDLEPEAAAVQTFLDSEAKCRSVNDTMFGDGTLELNSLLWTASKVFLDVLGDFDESEWLRNPRIGRHATVGNSQSEANVLKNIMQMSYHDPTGILRCSLYDIVGLRGVRLVETHCSNLSFVPKTAKTHRSICVEPGLNLAYQLSLGALIRKRLKRIGVDITDQSHNQRLARLGAIRGDVPGSYATIDLSSASDSISYGLVFRLFGSNPENGWLRAIDACRTPVTHSEKHGLRIQLEKVSSMGNGFTFPLETLIFYSIAKATAIQRGVGECFSRYNTAFYGDDIVVPTELFESLKMNLELCGFTLNEQKSYARTPYRESCGLHAYGGQLLRPIYIRERLQTVPDIFRIVNTLICVAAEESTVSETLSSRWQRPIREIIRMLPKSLRDYRAPLLRLPNELYKLSVTNFALYDPKFLSTIARERRSKTGTWEGWEVPSLYFASDRIITARNEEGQLAFTSNPFVAKAIESLMLYQLDKAPTWEAPGTPGWTPGSEFGVEDLCVRANVRRVKSRRVFIHSTFALPIYHWF